MKNVFTPQASGGLTARAFDPTRNTTESGFGDEPVMETASHEFSQANPPEVLKHALRLPINPNLKYRRIYLHVGVSLSVPGEDYFCRSCVCLLKAGRPVSNLPSTIAQDDGNTMLKQSVLSLFANNTNGAQDAIKVVFSTIFTGQSGSTILTPLRTASVADEITWSLEGRKALTGTITGVRVFLAVVSTNAMI